ncbi:MAG: glycosyl hydrolase family 28-related protein [Planctomycetota bacterium]
MNHPARFSAWLVWCGLCLSAMPIRAEVVFPADAGVINVTDFGVTPDDGVDDTAALQALLEQKVVKPSGGDDLILYFPDGVYLLSDTLQIPPPARYINLQGQSQSGTILKLQDRLRVRGKAFQDAMFNFGSGSADRFENSLRDLTLDVGVGNPAAVGLRFNASNQGVARDLTIRSSDPDRAGAIGLDLGYNGTIGPLLIKNVTIEGFDTGIRSQYEANSKVLEDITLRHQNRLGWQNSNTATVMVRNLVSENQVPVIDVGPALSRPKGARDPGNGRLVLIGGSFTGTGRAAKHAAVRVRNIVPRVYLRDVQTTGYAQAVRREARAKQGNVGLPDGHVEEYWFGGPGLARRGGTFQAFDNTPDTTLGLPVRETPSAPDEPPSAWVSPAAFGGVANDGQDDTTALQAAIDSGARTVYLPHGTWHVEGRVELRGNVHRLLGTEASLETTGNGRIVLGDQGPHTVVVERISGRLGRAPRVTYEHDSGRTWVFKNVSQWQYHPAADAPGDLFLEDVASGSRRGETFRNQNVWARQYNNEVPADTTDPARPQAKITVDAARLWVLGLKTEAPGTIVKTVNGGQTELLGVYRNGPGASGPDNPAFVTEDAALCVVVFSIRPNNAGYALYARETRDGVTVDVPRFNKANVYSAFDDRDLWHLRQSVYLDNADTRGVTLRGDWTTAARFDGGFIGENYAVSQTVGDTAVFAPDLPEGGVYEVAVRGVRPGASRNEPAPKPAAAVEVRSLDGVQQVAINPRNDGGRWVTLGNFRFGPGEAGRVVYTVTDGEDTGLVVDGVRFTRVKDLE